jgi:iduronate 2-sulfatase
MYLKLIAVIIFSSISVFASNLSILGKYKKETIAGQKASSAKQLLFKVSDNSFSKGSDVELSFSYLDRGRGGLFLSYASADPLDEDLKKGRRFRIADGIYLGGTGKWKQYRIRLKNIDFDQKGSHFQISLMAKGSVIAIISNYKIQPAKRVTKKAVNSKKLNVLMIIIDDLNDYIGAFGDSQAQTPNIDKFVAQGVRFSRAYCQYPVCGPSRASFLSGLYPESSGVLNNTAFLREVNPKAINMFEHFKKNGYWTAGSGKIFHSNFGLYEKGISFNEYEKPVNAANPQSLMLKARFIAEGASGDFKTYEKKHRVQDQAEQVLCYGTELRDDQHGDGRSARKVAQWILNNESDDKPFLMACGIVKPHVPFYAPKKYFDLYPQDKLKFSDVPENDWANKPKIAAVNGYKRFRSKLGVNNRKVRGEYLQAYLACISFMDAQVKVVLDALEKSGRADNTVVLFMSDHGFQIGEHFMYGKVTLFEECARVPFAIRLPGAKANGKTTTSFAELVDVYPTLVDLCGLPSPSHKLQGKSLAAILNDPNKTVRDSTYTVVTRGKKLGRSVRNDIWRFADWGSSQDIELYNLKDDPNQHNNLAKSPEYKEVLKQMSKLLKMKATKK